MNNSITYIKAIAIILMVWGHAECSIPHVSDFIYMFHMPLFYFASGYCFKNKYLDSPKDYTLSKVKNIYIPYVKWSVVFLLFHNLFFALHIYNEQDVLLHPYSFRQFLWSVYVIVTKMQGHEQLLGGYWFMRSLFVASLISYLYIWLCRGKLVMGVLSMLSISSLFYLFDFAIPVANINSSDFLVTSFVLTGTMFAEKKIKTFPVWMIGVSVLLTIFGLFIWRADTLHPEYPKAFPYYATAILMTWSLYSFFEMFKEKQSFVFDIIKYIGNNTFTILTWHFLMFKVVSLLIIIIYGLPIDRLSEFPVIFEFAHKGWWVVYLLFALASTAILAYPNKFIKNKYLKL